MHKLISLARAFNAVAVVTNQVMAKPDQFFGDATHPIGGHIVGHTSHTRIYLDALHMVQSASPGWFQVRICLKERKSLK